MQHLAWPFFDAVHRDHAKYAEAWAEGFLAHRKGGEDVDGSVRRLAKAMGEAGLLKSCAPEGRYDLRGLCLTREILSRHDGLADFAFVMQALGGAAIVLFGSDAQKAAYLPGVAAGDLLPAFALSEAEAGTDVGAIATTAVRDGGHYVLNGAKAWISNAGLADFYTVFARLGDQPGAKGLAAFIVPADAPGLSVTHRVETASRHPLAGLTFKDCRIPSSALLGLPGQGFKIAMTVFDYTRTSVAAAALGLARRALEEAVRRARTRHLFGQALGEFQMTQSKLAEMAVSVDAQALLTYRAAWLKDVKGERGTVEASMAKLFSTEEAQKVIDGAVQIWGAVGVVEGAVVERLYRDIRAMRIFEGANEVHKLIIARSLLS